MAITNISWLFRLSAAYGFIGVAAAWQVAFLLIAQDPLRYRLLILPGILEKLGFGVAALRPARGIQRPAVGTEHD